MAIHTVTFKQKHLEWASNRRSCVIRLAPAGASPHAPAIVTLRENAGFPLDIHLYAQTRTLYDGIAGLPTDYLQIHFLFSSPVPENNNAVIFINVFQEGATGYRIRGPFGFLSDAEQKELDEDAARLLADVGIDSGK